LANRGRDKANGYIAHLQGRYILFPKVAFTLFSVLPSFVLSFFFFFFFLIVYEVIFFKKKPIPGLL
jgi:hypothetical protein